MKRSIRLSIALTVSVVLLSLMKFDSTANAAPAQRFTADKGVVALGPNQVLRIGIDWNGDGDVSGADDVRVGFRRMEYTLVGTQGGVSRLAIASQNTSEPITLMPGEAASFDIPGTGNWGVRGIVVSNSPNLRVNAMIINTMTGEVVSLTKNESFKEVIFDFRL